MDARVPVRAGEAREARETDALLIEGDQMAPPGVPFERFALSGHGAGCGCCVPRSPAAAALDRLFQLRARGEVSFFRRVLAVTATAEGDLAVWSTLRHDPIASARFRPESD